VDGATEIGNSFTSAGGVLDSAKFYLKKFGTVTGNMRVLVYGHSGTYGDSSIADNTALLATSDNVSVSGLTTSLALITFDFTGAQRITLTSGYYVVVCKFNDMGDNSNYIFVGADTTSSTHSGNAVYYAAGESGWGAYNPEDIIFYVYVVR
jgi:hypothetical protein